MSKSDEMFKNPWMLFSYGDSLGNSHQMDDEQLYPYIDISLIFPQYLKDMEDCDVKKEWMPHNLSSEGR